MRTVTHTPTGLFVTRLVSPSHMKFFARPIAVFALLLVPTLALAQDTVADSGAFQFGRLLGIAAFCYIVWRVFFRKKR